MTDEEMAQIVGLIQEGYGRAMEVIKKDLKPDIDWDLQMMLLGAQSGVETAMVSIAHRILLFYGRSTEVKLKDGTMITIGKLAEKMKEKK